jgi:hypothetical protein
VVSVSTLVTTETGVVLGVTPATIFSAVVLAVTELITFPLPVGLSNTLTAVVVREVTGANGTLEEVMLVTGLIDILLAVTVVGNVRFIK